MTSVTGIKSYFYEFYEKHFPSLSGSGLNSFKVTVQSQNWIFKFTSISYYFTARDWRKALRKMFLLFYYYQNSKCLGRAVSGAEKDLNLAFIRY